jgi:hypothetical protein
MKKMRKQSCAVVLAAVAAMVLSPALSADGFGKWTFGVWGEGDIIPLKITAPKDGDVKLTTAAGPDYTHGADIEVEMGASLDDKIGFHLAMQPKPDATLVTLWSAHGWVKPFDWMTLRIGMFRVDDLRGTNKNGDGKDAVFARFASTSMDGVHVAVTPIKNLWLGMMTQMGVMDGWHDRKHPGDILAEENDAEKTYKNSQIGVGYRIPNIGHVRAQFLGNANWQAGEVDSDWIRYEAAFNLTAIKSFDIDAGIKIPQNAEVQGYDIQAALVVFYYGDINSWGDPFNITGRVDLKIKDDPYFKFYAGPQYRIGDNLWLGGDVTFSATTNAGDDNLDIGAYVKKVFGRGSFIKAGIQAGIPVGDQKVNNLIVSFPIAFEWSLY